MECEEFSTLDLDMERDMAHVDNSPFDDDFFNVATRWNPCQTRFYAIGIMQDQRQSTTRVGPTS